jgi:recombination protein RecR
MVHHLLESPEEEAQHLADSIKTMRSSIRRCRICYNYSEEETCPICAAANRDQRVICVVERPVDVDVLERAHHYSGVYHVLGGVLSPINGITVDRLRIEELLQRIDATGPAEIILGLGGSAEAETTITYLIRLLAGKEVKITRFSRGLPAGFSLEYVDHLTLTQALAERIEAHYE